MTLALIDSARVSRPGVFPWHEPVYNLVQTSAGIVSAREDAYLWLSSSSMLFVTISLATWNADSKEPSWIFSDVPDASRYLKDTNRNILKTVVDSSSYSCKDFKILVLFPPTSIHHPLPLNPKCQTASLISKYQGAIKINSFTYSTFAILSNKCILTEAGKSTICKRKTFQNHYTAFYSSTAIRKFKNFTVFWYIHNSTHLLNIPLWT